MFVSLIPVQQPESMSSINTNNKRTIAGSTVSSLYLLKDLDGVKGAFFVFPNISIRMEGIYKLKFSLFEMTGYFMLVVIYRDVVKNHMSVCSEDFTVYSAKKFPGMEGKLGC